MTLSIRAWAIFGIIVLVFCGWQLYDQFGMDALWAGLGMFGGGSQVTRYFEVAAQQEQRHE